MTPAERRAALVDRMRDTIAMIYESRGITEVAEDALAVALEEAAKVADGYHRIVETRRDLFEDGNVTTTTGHSLVDPRKIAAAIRSLTNK